MVIKMSKVGIVINTLNLYGGNYVSSDFNDNHNSADITDEEDINSDTKVGLSKMLLNIIVQDMQYLWNDYSEEDDLTSFRDRYQDILRLLEIVNAGVKMTTSEIKLHLESIGLVDTASITYIIETLGEYTDIILCEE